MEMTQNRINQIDLATRLLNTKTNMLELTLGECTHTETLKEGRTVFTFECIFCNENNEQTKKNITVNIKGFK